LAATAILVLALLFVAAPADPVRAEPDAAQPEGGSASLNVQLDEAVRGYNDATARLEMSKARQAALVDQMRTTESQVGALTDHVDAIAVTAYKGGRISALSALLSSSSPDGVLQRAVALESQARNDNQELRQLRKVNASLNDQQSAIEREIKTQQDQIAEMGRRKQAAEEALATETAANSAGSPTAGDVQAARHPAAVPVPRRADGTLGPQSCSVKDPTTSGCITPRMLNALQQARAASFTRYTSCYRPQQDGGEPPVGRACDFSASASGFGGVATGGDKAYGDRLAAYFIANARQLGVLYVIWYRQIWLPSSGWRGYSGGGSPSADHTNHVHLSVQ
jgi:hypothetical protein